MKDLKEIEHILIDIAQKYPEELIEEQLGDVNRVAFHIDTVIKSMGEDITICDLGGGIGLFSLGCAAMGMKTILVDDFRDEVNKRFNIFDLGLHRKFDVQILSADIVKGEIGFGPYSIDAVTSFGSMEHWHNSPKNIFKKITKVLVKRGGLFFIGVPNSVSIRKRVTVPLGHGNWSSINDWYEKETFRGHVREFDVADLKYIGKDLDLKNVRIFGRNWMVYHKHKTMAIVFDNLLRVCPSLCSDIYMAGNTNED